MKTTLIILTLIALAFALFTGSALAQTGGQLTQTTTHYKIMLEIGPVANMLMPDQAAGAKSGEVMVQMPGMATPQMTMTDEGHPVNHHLEVFINDKNSGAPVKDTVPTITIMNQATGAMKQVAAVAPMYNVMVGQSDFHWGNNVYLADGMYTVTVKEGGDTATFKDVNVSGGTSPSTTMPVQGMTPTPSATGPMTTTTGMTSTTGMPGSVPMTGGDFSAGWNVLLALGGLVIAALGLMLLTRRVPREI